MSLSFKEFEQQGWERVAGAYHDCFGQITPQVARELVHRAGIRPQDQVLDIACGPGYVAALSSAQGANAVGIDFSSGMIQQAKAFYPHLDFQVMDAEQLGFDDERFDIACMNFGILHLANPEQAISEAFRVLKREGKFLFTVWDKPVRSKAFEIIFNALKQEGDLNVPLPEGPDFFQFSDVNTATEILHHAGFGSVEAISLELTWTLASAEELFQAFYRAGIRIGGILRAQKEEAIGKIITHIEQQTLAYQKSGKIELPISVILYKAEKSI